MICEERRHHILIINLYVICIYYYIYSLSMTKLCLQNEHNYLKKEVIDFCSFATNFIHIGSVSLGFVPFFLFVLLKKGTDPKLTTLIDFM